MRSERSVPSGSWPVGRRRSVDAIFRACPVEVWEGYSRPLIRVADFLEWRERSTYRGDRVRPTAGLPR